MVVAVVEVVEVEAAAVAVVVAAVAEKVNRVILCMPFNLIRCTSILLTTME